MYFLKQKQIISLNNSYNGIDNNNDNNNSGQEEIERACTLIRQALREIKTSKDLGIIIYTIITVTITIILIFAIIYINIITTVVVIMLLLPSFSDSKNYCNIVTRTRIIINGPNYISYYLK